MLRPYSNEPFTDWSNPANVAAQRQALAKIQSELGKNYPNVIGSERITTPKTFPTVNPARPNEVLAYFPEADAALTDKALDAATQAFQTWQHVPVEERARYLLRASAEMRRRRFDFNAAMVLEAGKSWFEADIDTAEAIDFMEYYVRQALRLTDASHQLASYPPEQLELRYVPLGVGAIIPPWNFPNAILAGTTVAGIVTGNTVILKPAEQTPLIGYMVAELFWNIDLPAGVLNFLTCSDGAVVGGRLVESPKTRFVNFTGSRNVGVAIYEKVAKVHPGQKWLKRAVLEMGGKNAVVVDETADLIAAADGIVASAFGFQGQKCSAGSRAIIVDSVYDVVASKVVEGTKKLSVGATDAGHEVFMGPVVDQEAFDRIRSYIEIGAKEGKLLTGGKVIETNDNGFFIEPTVFGDVPEDARIAQEEIFGPVVALIRARDYTHALQIANSTEYGLTGAVFSNVRERLEQARREFHVGNLYFNRKATGALVGVHPFGGFNMSGTDTKGGGPDYLLNFMQGKSIAEKL
jgi:1-pyrroline-5-carboxylate dehydrogenase